MTGQVDWHGAAALLQLATPRQPAPHLPLPLPFSSLARASSSVLRCSSIDC